MQEIFESVLGGYVLNVFPYIPIAKARGFTERFIINLKQKHSNHHQDYN